MKNAQVTKEAAADAMAQIVASAPVAAAVAAEAKAKPVARTRRAAQKPVAAQPQSAVVATAKIIGVKYTFAALRPTAGRGLKAYTEAVLQLLGMYKGKAYPRATLAAIIGVTAVNYHVTRTGAFAMSNDGIGLTPGFGNDFFAMRKTEGEFDPQDVEDYKTILATGKADNRLIKNQSMIKPFAA